MQSNIQPSDNNSKEPADTDLRRPLVTFAILAYNQEEYVREAVDGAFAQTYRPLEIILSDDCSEDGTFDEMAILAEDNHGDRSVVVRRNPRNYGTLNHLLSVAREARGDFLVVAAGDDISMPKRTSALTDKLLHSGSDVWVVYSDDCLFAESDEINVNYNYLKTRKRHSGKSSWYLGATACYRTSVLRALPLSYDKVLFEDKALIASFSKGPMKSAWLKSPLVKRRMHSENLGPIRAPSDSDVWQSEISALNYVRQASLAHKYASAVLRQSKGDETHQEKHAAFLDQYSQWPILPFWSRLKLLSVSWNHGYLKAMLIRVFGRKIFLAMKRQAERANF